MSIKVILYLFLNQFITNLLYNTYIPNNRFLYNISNRDRFIINKYHENNIFFIPREKNGVAAVFHTLCDMKLYCYIYNCHPIYIYGQNIEKYYEVRNANILITNNISNIKRTGFIKGKKHDIKDFNRLNLSTYDVLLAQQQNNTIIKVCHEFSDILLIQKEKAFRLKHYFEGFSTRSVMTTYYHKCFSSILSPMGILTDYLNKIMNIIPSSCYKIGIQIRTFDKAKFNIEQYILLVKKILDYTQNINNNTICLLISADRDIIISQLQHVYQHIYSANIGETGHSGGNLGLVNDDILLRTFVDIELMKKCNEVYVTQYSGFGYLIMEVVDPIIPVHIISKSNIYFGYRELYTQPKNISNLILQKFINRNEYDVYPPQNVTTFEK